MGDVEPFLKSFKSGELDKVLVFIYSFFIIGYLILFITYEERFLNLEFSTQIILSTGISFPITIFSSIFLAVIKNRSLNKDIGFIFQLEGELRFVSFIYSALFSIFYLVKHSIFSLGDNSFVALLIITFGLLLLLILNIIFSKKV